MISISARYSMVICAGLLAACGGPQASIPAPQLGAPFAAVPAMRVAGITYKTVASFQGKTYGDYPTGNLVAAAGSLYGTTYGGGNDDNGTIFKVSNFGKVSVLHRFAGGADGSSPYESGLVNVKGTLFGVTENGGTGCPSGCGTVFKTSTAGAEHVIYSFRGGSGGFSPTGPLAAVNGVLYGTTQGGGSTGCRGYGCGVVFSVNTAGTNFRVLYRFAGGTDGAEPFGGLVSLNGKLYGTTTSGGSSYCKDGCGTVYEIGMSGGEHVLYTFKGGKDGAGPNVLIAVNGVLYGTTAAGGIANCGYLRCGTIFAVSTSGQERVIYRFKGGIADGSLPEASLFYLNGTFYGTTLAGGSCAQPRNGCGVVFALSAPGKERVLHTFAGGLDGASPQGGLVAFNSWLYGATAAGGTSSNCGSQGCGTAFKVLP